MEKLKEKFKFVWNKKLYSGILLAFITIISVIFYGYKYVIEKQIIFDEKDLFLIIIYGSILLIISFMLIFVIIKLKKMEEKFDKLTDFLINFEDDNDKQHRTTQEFIMELKNAIWGSK